MFYSLLGRRKKIILPHSFGLLVVLVLVVNYNPEFTPGYVASNHISLLFIYELSYYNIIAQNNFIPEGNTILF